MTAEEDEIRELARHAKALFTKFDSYFVGDMRVVPWVPENGFFELIFKAAVIRQHEGLSAIADLVLMERGDAAVALLRPACEEFIVLRYLTTIDREDAEELDERLLESSGLVRRAHQIGDRYTIYVRRVTPARAEGDASIRRPQCHDDAGLVWNRLCSAKSRSSALVHNSDRGREFAWPRLPSSDHLAIRHPERRHRVENFAPDPCLDSLCCQPSRSHR